MSIAATGRWVARRFPGLVSLLAGIPFLRASNKLRLILTVRPYTMMSHRKLSALADLAQDLRRRRIEGSFVECGVRNGGSAGILAAEAGSRIPVWLFDSWEGLPDPTDTDISALTGRIGARGMFLGSQATVEHLLFTRLQLDRRNIHLVKGWFAESLPPHKREMGPIAFLLLDCTFYESYKFCLDELYDSVVPGGIVWLDDYGTWQGARRAVQEFLQSRNLHVTLTGIQESDGSKRAVYFRK